MVRPRPKKGKQGPSSPLKISRSVASAVKPSQGPTDSHSNAPPFLVAAVGASAGGLEAFSKLLARIGPDTPLALVLVQHLARDQRSILPELLDKATRLKVVLAEDAVRIQAGHVYVIAPNVRMTVFDGSLHVRPIAPGEQQGAIDTLFRSVASEYKERGLGIILSGSAYDGAAGVREIKAAGGITLVQTPEEATVDGMPRAAIATGHVDSVLPVEAIAELLVQLAKSPFFHRDHAATDPTVGDLGNMARAFQLLRKSSGIDFAKYKPATLRRRLDRRMSLRRVTELGDYVALLHDDPLELQRLQEDLLIHVTSFFRDPPSYAALAQLVFPRLFDEREEDETIRFWIPGCSSGEEVYSLAILADEYLTERGRNADLQIFGTDVSETVIARARSGIFPASVDADLSPGRLRGFFSRVTGGGYRINKSVRDRCVFARQDITRDPPFSRIDLIVCRNLLIYLNQVTQQKVLQAFHYSLQGRGVLMLGPSESIGTQFELFAPLAKNVQLYTKRPMAGATEANAVASTRPSSRTGVPRTGSPPAPPAVPRTNEERAWDFQTEANRFLLDRYSPPAVVIDRENLRVVRARGDTSTYLQVPDGEVSLDVTKMVRPGLANELRDAITKAHQTGTSVFKKKLPFIVDRRARTVDLQVEPLGGGKGGQLLVIFDEGASSMSTPKNGKEKANKPGRQAAASAQSMKTLERELLVTRDQLQGIIDDLAAANEELQSANEEVLSSNEELQSTNEELDTAKEELQSTNEELVTVNDELRSRNEDLSLANSDLSNLLTSVQIPIVMVTRDLRLRQATPAAEKLLNIIRADIGRPISHLKLNFLYEGLDSMITEVIESMTVKEREVEAEDGRIFMLQIRPYQTVDNRIDGAVVVLFDISIVREQAAALDLARGTGEALMSHMKAPVLLLDDELKVTGVNEPFYDYFAVRPGETTGRHVFDLGNGQWDIPALRTLLEEVLPQKKNFSGFKVSHTFPKIGPKAMVLDARTIESAFKKKRVILLTFQEVS